MAAVPAGVQPSPEGGILVGVISSTCKGEPLQARIRLVSRSGDTTSTDADERGGFVLPPASPGNYNLEIASFSHRRISDTVSLAAGRVDTVQLVLRFDDSFVHHDCLCPDQRSMGAQCCLPKKAGEC